VIDRIFHLETALIKHLEQNSLFVNQIYQVKQQKLKIYALSIENGIRQNKLENAQYVYCYSK